MWTAPQMRIGFRASPAQPRSARYLRPDRFVREDKVAAVDFTALWFGLVTFIASYCDRFRCETEMKREYGGCRIPLISPRRHDGAP
jgi:hypothetical protein